MVWVYNQCPVCFDPNSNACMNCGNFSQNMA